MPRSVPDEDLYLMLLIRRFEQALLRLFGEGRIAGTTHACLGQEYVPVALRPLLRTGDHVFSNHRGHGHYLARHEDPVGLLAEITGRIGGVCAGVGRRFGLDPWIARLLFIVVLLALPGSQILVDPILWILMPSEQPSYATSAYPPSV